LGAQGSYKLNSYKQPRCYHRCATMSGLAITRVLASVCYSRCAIGGGL